MKWIAGLFQEICRVRFDFDQAAQKRKAAIASNNLDYREGNLLLLQKGSWKNKHVMMKGGVMFFYAQKGSEREFKFPLYKCTIGEHKPEEFPAGFAVSGNDGSLILQANDIEDMQQWLNAILNQKIKIEEVIDCIVTDE